MVYPGCFRRADQRDSGTPTEFFYNLLGGVFAMAQSQSQSDTVHVFDTWVRGAKQHLTSLGEGAVPVTVKECQFCHTEPLVMFNSEQQRQFREQGGFIITLS